MLENTYNKIDIWCTIYRSIYFREFSNERTRVERRETFRKLRMRENFSKVDLLKFSWRYMCWKFLKGTRVLSSICAKFLTCSFLWVWGLDFMVRFNRLSSQNFNNFLHRLLRATFSGSAKRVSWIFTVFVQRTLTVEFQSAKFDLL